jgi:hypothetical protein
MHEAAQKKLRLLLANTEAELHKNSDKYSALMIQLAVLDRSLAAGNLDYELIKVTLAAFPARIKPSRAARPADETLKETKTLWEELNRIVVSRPKGSLRLEQTSPV